MKETTEKENDFVRSIGGGPEVAPDRSRWNRFLDHRLACGDAMTKDGHRLADALMRALLGWNKVEERFGRGLLRESSGLYGRSFERACDNLVAVGLLEIERGGRGRGRRTLYRLVLDAQENAGDARPFEKAGDARPFDLEKAAGKAAEKAGNARPGSEKREGESRRLSPQGGPFYVSTPETTYEYGSLALAEAHAAELGVEVVTDRVAEGAF